MRIKNKLLITLLTISLVPIIFLGIFSIANFTSVSTNVTKSAISKIAGIQNTSLNNYLSDISLTAKRMSSDINFTSFGQLVNIPNKTSEQNAQYNKYSSEVFTRMMAMFQVDSNIESIYLLNNKDEKVMKISQYDKVNDLYLNKFAYQDLRFSNGFSQFLNNQQYSNAIYFAFQCVIIDEKGQTQAKLLIFYRTNEIQDILNNSKQFQTQNNILLDGDGMTLQYPYVYLNKFDENTNYEGLAPQVKNGADNKLCYYSNDNQKFVSYQLGVPHTNWKLLNIVSESELSSLTSGNTSGLIVILVFLTIAIIILCFLFVKHFTKPLDEIMFVLKKKQRGDKFATFNVTTNNEFGNISKAFNTMVDEITESEQRYRTVVEMSENIIFEYNIKKNFVRFSDNFNLKFSFRAKSEKYEDSFWMNCQVHPDDKARYLDTLSKAFKKANYVQGEFRFKSIYGDYVWALIRASMLYSKDEKPNKVIGVMVDIDRAKKNEMRLLQKASFDSLTQLYNRETFEKRMINEFELSRMRKETNAILFIDLDDFKNFNDSYGHSFGDEVLRYVSHTISMCVGNMGFAGRYGGDEFIICINSQHIVADSQKLAKSLIDEFKKGYTSEITNEEVKICCSIGISLYDETANNTESIISEADEAMYSVKKHGKSNFALHSKNK